MGAREEERKAMNAADKVKPPSLLRPSPCVRRSVIQAAAPPSRLSAPISGARKAKTPSKSPSASCTSAPAGSTRSPAGGMPTRNPSPKAKRGMSSVSIGVVRERHSVPVIQKGPQVKHTAPYLLIPVRLKRTGLKLLDPEKVKNLTSASRVPVSGDVKQNIIPRLTAVNRQMPWSHKQNPLPRPSVKQTESSRRRTGITRRRENTSQAAAEKTLPSGENTGRHRLSHQMNQLHLDDKGCDESRTSANGQVSNGPPQPGDDPRDARNSGQTTQGEESNVQDIEKSSHLSSAPAMSEETEGNLTKQDAGMSVLDSSSPQTGGVQEQLPGAKESLSQPPLCHVVENHIQDPPTSRTQPGCPDLKVVDGPHETPKSNHNHLKDTGTNADISYPVSPPAQKDFLTNLGEAEADSAEDDLKTPDFPPHDRNTTEIGSQKELNQCVCLRTNNILRQSQGVLVLTRSTDENAIFIPKLKFEFTPDNSIDWTTAGPPPLDSIKGGPTKKNDPRILNACTPRGPTFSKRFLKKSFMLSGQDHLPGGSSEPALRLSSAGEVTRRPLDRIVDLSISFQGKFEEQEIPADIPKILLTEEDYDED